MTRHRNPVFASALISCGLLVSVPGEAAQVTQVNGNTWGASGVPDYVTMYIYVPDQLAPKPPVLVACHSCGTPVSGYVNSIGDIRAAADQNGFIIILPEATGRNCWDVGSSKGLTRDGGGDAHAIAQMVKYVLEEYDGDPERVYALGGSSGAMMTQALMALYPDVFKAGSARAGVPAGCWADGYDPSNQWGGNCANGNTKKSAQEWGDQVRAMYPGYTGHRPRIQLFHGDMDETIRYPNFGEAIKEWTNVLGLSETPTSTDMVTTPNATYTRQFWENECGYTVLEAWSGKGGKHSMPYEQDAILEFFGLDEAGGTDPEPDCSGQGGSGGSGGMDGMGGSGGVSGGQSAGAGAGGATAGSAGAGTAGSPDSGGMGGGGEPSIGGAGTQNGGSAGLGVGGSAGLPQTSGGSGGTPAGTTGGVSGSPANTTGGTANGGSTGTASSGAPGAGAPGAPGSGGSQTGGAPPSESGGCAFVASERSSKHAFLSTVALGLVLALRRRLRRAQR